MTLLIDVQAEDIERAHVAPVSLEDRIQDYRLAAQSAGLVIGATALNIAAYSYAAGELYLSQHHIRHEHMRAPLVVGVASIGMLACTFLYELCGILGEVAARAEHYARNYYSSR
jgi:hypothetical protein